MKYWDIDLKNVQDLYTENGNTLLREIKKDLNKQKIKIQRLKDSIVLSCHYFIYIKLIYRFNPNHIKIWVCFFGSHWKADPKIHVGLQSY